jgi:hypothetical protein
MGAGDPFMFSLYVSHLLYSRKLKVVTIAMADWL